MTRPSGPPPFSRTRSPTRIGRVWSAAFIVHPSPVSQLRTSNCGYAPSAHSTPAAPAPHRLARLRGWQGALASRRTQDNHSDVSHQPPRNLFFNVLKPAALALVIAEVVFPVQRVACASWAVRELGDPAAHPAKQLHQLRLALSQFPGQVRRIFGKPAPYAVAYKGQGSTRRPDGFD